MTTPTTPGLSSLVFDDKGALLSHRPLDGVLVMEAPPGTPGAQAGLVGCMRQRNGHLVLGDLITAVNDMPVRAVEDLLTLVEETHIGASVTLNVNRNADPLRPETIQVLTVDRALLAR